MKGLVNLMEIAGISLASYCSSRQCFIYYFKAPTNNINTGNS